ncbi:HWE histidine kinase domain-containing protein [Tardiphaga sp. vice278]|uniref:HWE histidine kinase domain-containing protein n=1 Tax=Tardiphaga sp. vice278 TaxID=2592815 RepID=UPI0011632551|nr:HWE histidine kinase domain-containing protein [Tardiphaga sp. vice278]QDM15421.1 GAF domain-containing protein [Tardiphaga sp. vice278]
MAELGFTTASVDVTNCDREPIHIPGAILPHGAMLVLDADTLEIIQAAGDTSRLLGVPLGELLGQSAATLFRPDQIENLRGLAAALDLAKPRHLLDPQMRVITGLPLDASLHRSAGSLVLEFEAAHPSDWFAADPLAGVEEMVRGFDESSSLKALCQLAADRVRDVARYDRVLVYRFMHDDSGWVIAESMEPHLEPFLGLHYPAADIPQQARALYVKNWLRLITQVDYDSAPLIPVVNPRTGEPLDMSQAILRDVSPIHRQYLRNMGIDASMSISIIRGDKLWGLIACHHYSPRILPRHLRAICELFGSMFSLQLEVREKGEQFGERLASRMILQNLMLNLASADDYAAGLTRESPNLLDYIHCGLLSADGTRQGGVAVSVKGQLTFLGTTPSQAQILSLVDWLNPYVSKNDGVFSTDCLSEFWPPASAFADVASGVLVISVTEELSDFIIWFRPELVGTSEWAGEPTKLVESGPNGDQLRPRKSFEVWKETVCGHCLPWTPADLDAAFDLRVSLLHVVLRRINTAALVRKRAAERDKVLMAELDHRVKNTIANIQALVIQSSRNAESLTGFVKGLEGRILAMAKAHSLLSESRWEGVSIARLLREELNHYATRHRAVSFDGVDIVLTPKSALSLSLAVHELATNAAKYGAFTETYGHVAVDWRRANDGSVELSWTETGGPLVEQPKRRGFGTTLIERALAMETGGHSIVQYLRGGVVCNILLPASSVSESDANVVDGASVQAQRVQMAEVPAASPPEIFRILVVEDSFLLIMTIQAMLDDLGWVAVGPATRKAEAIALAQLETFDAALLDVNLDGETSWDVAAILMSRGIPFVFGTAYDVSSVLPDHLAGSAVIAKPYVIRDVEQRLREVIAIKRRLTTAVCLA